MRKTKGEKDVRKYKACKSAVQKNERQSYVFPSTPKQASL